MSLDPGVRPARPSPRPRPALRVRAALAAALALGAPASLAAQGGSAALNLDVRYEADPDACRATHAGAGPGVYEVAGSCAGGYVTGIPGLDVFGRYAASATGSARSVVGVSLGAAASVRATGTAGQPFVPFEQVGVTARAAWTDVLIVAPLHALTPEQILAFSVVVPYTLVGSATGGASVGSGWNAQATAMLVVGGGSDLAQESRGSGAPYSDPAEPVEVPLAMFAQGDWRLAMSMTLSVLAFASANADAEGKGDASSSADFGHTATLDRVFVRNGAGVDVSSLFSLTTASGRSFDVPIAAVPEPATAALVAAGLALLGVGARRLTPRAS